MPVCEVCGNDYDKAFEVRAEGATHVFELGDRGGLSFAPKLATPRRFPRET